MTPPRISVRVLAGAAAIVLGLSACGATDTPAPPSSSPTSATSSSAPTPSQTQVAPPTSATPEPPPPPAPPTKVVATPADPRPFSEPEPIPQELSFGMDSPLVRELQIRLRHAKYLAEYDSTSNFGERTRVAVVNFQRDHGLPMTGLVGQMTWDALLPKSHEPTEAELNNTDIGPWVTGPSQPAFVMEVQHRLRQLNIYTGAIDGELNQPTIDAIGGYRNSIGLPASEIIDERTWTSLQTKTRNPGYSELFTLAPVSELSQELDPRCLSGKVICVSKDQLRMSLVIDGVIQFTREARFSMPGWDSPKGDYRVWYMDAHEVSVIFGERTPMPYAIYYNRDIAIHYSDNFNDYGYEGGSHGCTQSYDYQAMKWLFEQTRIGDRVVVY